MTQNQLKDQLKKNEQLRNTIQFACISIGLLSFIGFIIACATIPDAKYTPIKSLLRGFTDLNIDHKKAINNAIPSNIPQMPKTGSTGADGAIVLVGGLLVAGAVALLSLAYVFTGSVNLACSKSFKHKIVASAFALTAAVSVVGGIIADNKLAERNDEINKALKIQR